MGWEHRFLGGQSFRAQLLGNDNERFKRHEIAML
jgi:hypothetical protein